MEVPGSPPEVSAKESILVIDDEQEILSSLQLVLQNAGFQVSTTAYGEEALQILSKHSFDLILCDLQMPQMDGLSFLRKLQSSDPGHSVIVMSAHGTDSTAIEAIQNGAYDYISKPFRGQELILIVRKALERERLQKENALLKDEVSKRYSFANIIAKSASMMEIFETIKKIADYRTTVMITGESGTGKELIARALHYNSLRQGKRFVAINCGAIPENLLESELFGHRRGAFTDATKDKKGLFEEAEGGTLLLDEVGELPLHLQVKLLRVLQENEIRPVGDSRVIPVNVRMIAATLRDLEQDILDGRFRDDLFYRLNVVTIRIPPLRERKEDILLLVNYFLKKQREKLGIAVSGIAKDAMAAIMDHHWPGNIRELENCIERAMILTEEKEITLASLPRTLKRSVPKPLTLDISQDELSIKVHSRILEENLIRKALTKTGGNRTHAAKLLEISHRTLLYKLKEYNIEIDMARNEIAKDSMKKFL